MEKTIYTAKEGERITSVKTIDNSIVITIEPRKKTWENYAKEIGYSVHNGLRVVDVPAIFNIALAIMNDLNGGWKPNWNDTEQKYSFVVHENAIDYYFSISFQHALFHFKSKETTQQFIDICGKEFIFKLYGR